MHPQPAVCEHCRQVMPEGLASVYVPPARRFIPICSRADTCQGLRRRLVSAALLHFTTQHTWALLKFAVVATAVVLIPGSLVVGAVWAAWNRWAAR